MCIQIYYSFFNNKKIIKMIIVYKTTFYFQFIHNDILLVPIIVKKKFISVDRDINLNISKLHYKTSIHEFLERL